MNLPKDFQFSQGLLQDAADCERRFQLRYLKLLEWPALIAEPAMSHENHTRKGVQFHRLVQQHQLGIPLDRLNGLADEPDLNRWWQNYIKHPIENLPLERQVEAVLAAPVAGFRLLAKYDLIAIEPEERAVIVDWKTSRKKPPRQWLAERLQTRVYRYLLVRAGAHLNGDLRFSPNQVEMVYWFSEFPEEPEVFRYSTAEFEQDEAIIAAQIHTLNKLHEDQFAQTDETRHCRYCAYRSLCDRGVQAGDLRSMHDSAYTDDVDLDLDLEQIAEIEF